MSIKTCPKLALFLRAPIFAAFLPLACVSSRAFYLPQDPVMLISFCAWPGAGIQSGGRGTRAHTLDKRKLAEVICWKLNSRNHNQTRFPSLSRITKVYVPITMKNISTSRQSPENRITEGSLEVNMNRWKSRGGKSQRKEEQKKKDQRRERVRRKKMQAGEKVEKSRIIFVFQ